MVTGIRKLQTRTTAWVGDEAMGEVQGALKDEGLKSNRDDRDLEDGHVRAVPAQGVLQVLPQTSQGSSVVFWERFLHVRSIKVLLVENDDSTRHVVTALLRNCNYDVMEAANGLHAWKILEDLTNHIDLVLTELVMPCLSGIGLLCKIMSHKTRKNIPVIMMSSHDSMGLVFKCLSKGAVDFLVKPIRKNELKNLWQHVWRRCHSSSGSGSESGTQTQKSIKSKGCERSDNNSGSNDEEDNGCQGLNIGDGSDDGSGTQSSWTKQAVEVDSSQARSPWDQIVEFPDSTCAQVIHLNAETFDNKCLPITATRECSEQKEQLVNVAKSEEFVLGKPRNLELPGNPIDVPVGILDERCSAENSKQMEKGSANCGGECPSNKRKTMNLCDHQMDDRESERPIVAKVSDSNKDIHELKEATVIELSLKRLRGVKDTGKAVQDARNVLRRSELSAFSRYNTNSNAFKPPNGMMSSSSLLDNSLEVKKESVCDVRSHSKGNILYPSTNVVSNNNIDMGSTTNHPSSNRLVPKDKSEATSAINGSHPSSVFKPTRSDIRCTPQQVMVVKADDMAAVVAVAPQRGSHQELQMQHVHHHHHHHHHHFHNTEQQPLLSNHDDISLKKLAADAPHCASSNVLGGLLEGNPGNYSLNRSASGSNHGSNGQNGSSTAVNAGGTNVESDIGVAGKNGSGDVSGSGSGSGNRIDQNKSSQREAALNKFRQKRKERCFRKKVRYQNRKRLAEQRPRVRGQFVRQTGLENSNSAADG